MIGKFPNKPAVSTNKKTLRLIGRDPLSIKSITADNGTEFHQYKKIEAHCSAKFYFANPYHSWELGSNEVVTDSFASTFPK